MPVFGKAFETPGVGGEVQGCTANSQASLSGVTALRGCDKMSVVILTGVPLLSKGPKLGSRFPAVILVYTGSTDIEFTSWLVAACQLASVAWLLPLYPTNAFAVPASI